MHFCWFCHGEVIWDNDFDGEDAGYDNASIVTFLHCQKCGATWEGIQWDEEEEIDDEKIKEHNTSNRDGD